MRNFLTKKINKRWIGFFIIFVIFAITIWSSNKIVQELKREEHKRVENYALSLELISSSEFLDPKTQDFLFKLIEDNKSIPVALVDEKGIIVDTKNIDESIVLKPFERRLISTGLHIALPVGYEAQIRPRSGLALKHGITVLNTPGTVDADYRGEIMVLLINFSSDEFIINDGERIAQMIIARHENAEFIAVEELDETERGEGGYGHTGVK